METKNCQNCKQNFVIELDDFSFYEKIKVPPPTWCPECRMIRRMMYRNERTLYKQNCDLCGKSTISMYDPTKGYVVYCTDCYASDNWNPNDFARDYDFSKPFFEQLAILFKKIPRRALYQDFAVNSEYTNQSVYMKNCYLCFGGHHYEDSNYCAQNFYLKNCLDVDFSQKSELCFDSCRLMNCFQVRFGYFSENCINSWFIYGCRNCSDCVGCVNLVNKTHFIFNEQYTKEEYEEKIKEFDFSNQENIDAVKKQFWDFSLQFPRKYANIKNVVNSTGDNLEQLKNCKRVFYVSQAEDVNYSFFSPTGAKDSYDIDHVGLGAVEICDLHSGFEINRVFFSNRIYYSHNVAYSDDVYHCNDIFASAGLRKKSYCILNKQYSKEEYDELVLKIIKHMEDIPYVDGQGRTYKYGDFFPFEIIPFAYNESVIFEYFPLGKEEILEKGYKFKKPEIKNYKATILPSGLPNIKDVDDKILDEIIQCEHNGECNHRCTTAFRLIPGELNISKILGIPLPRLCPNCRHMERISILNAPRLYHRKCMKKSCTNEFETSYAPERPEIIYCERCYQQEVY